MSDSSSRVKDMDENGFREFVREGKRVPKGLTERTIRLHLQMVKEFESFLNKRSQGTGFEQARARDAKAFVKELSREGRCTFDNFIGLLRYSRFLDNRDVEQTLILLLDGSNVLAGLCRNVEQRFGKKRAAKILGGYVPPAVGTPPKKMPKATSDFLNRLESAVAVEEVRKVLIRSPHAGPPSYYDDDKKTFKEAKSIDEYLHLRHEKFLDVLREHMENGTLFFNQPIDQRVLAWVKANPEIGGGARKGSFIYCTKVPYMAIEYLREKDRTLKRYYYCHCPLARESIVMGKEMSRNLCYCSAGYEKAPFEAAFGVPVKIEVLKSVLWGDSLCRFAIEIPKGVRKRMSSEISRQAGKN